MRSMFFIWRNRTRMGRARMVGLAGAILVAAGIILWLIFLFALFTPEERTVPDRMGQATIIHSLFALLVLLGILVPWPLITALLLAIAFAGSFVAQLGWYFLLTPSPLMLAGVGDILYLVAAIMVVYTAFSEPSRRGSEAS